MKFHLDEHMDPAIADGLRRRGIDVTTTLDASLGGAPDETHLEYARQSQRVILTDDIDEHPVVIDACLNEADMRNRIEFC